jgi:hypothetical protein
MKENMLMRRDILEEYLKRRPFLPFRVYLSTGVFFDIHQPQLASVSHFTLTLGLPIEGNRQRFLEIALIHIVWIEMLIPAL